jgi:hypothetical protein
VIDGGRPGGSFAVSKRPAFYLNSRNRPGPLGLPLTKSALNFLPGAEIQPAHISEAEYQTNNDLAFIIRATLARYANVVTGRQVVGVERSAGGARPYRLRFSNGDTCPASRVIIATGLGRPAAQDVFPGLRFGGRIASFEEFMAMFDTPFPLRGMGRVAVVGAGDGGKTVIEALTGQGPAATMSVAALDYPTQIDWWGIGANASCNNYGARSRYKGISALLPQGARRGRVTPKTPASAVMPGYECAFVDDTPYDHVIVALGYKPDNGLGLLQEGLGYAGGVEGGVDGFGSPRPIARLMADEQIYLIGPAANLTLSQVESAAAKIQFSRENAMAIFRYAPRTAELAAGLPRVG